MPRIALANMNAASSAAVVVGGASTASLEPSLTIEVDAEGGKFIAIIVSGGGDNFIVELSIRTGDVSRFLPLPPDTLGERLRLNEAFLDAAAFFRVLYIFQTKRIEL